MTPSLATALAPALAPSLTPAPQGVSAAAGPADGLSPGLRVRPPVGLPSALPLPRSLRGPSRWGPGVTPAHARPTAPLMVAVGLVLGAVLLAPEQPRAQEAICHRHNGVAACRVW
ncbi:hypothetical protein [Synechococcus sp. CCY 9618]|uniref:hypothetical protein n=1 Tax=Synechococcus sp. CCY 9618 TaxID=2815602 RepID=UPI001C230791|nr:hypothetical protein [Synechococcus sp. CCY 9618]